jgi:hypothetical protein
MTVSRWHANCSINVNVIITVTLESAIMQHLWPQAAFWTATYTGVRYIPREHSRPLTATHVTLSHLQPIKQYAQFLHIRSRPVTAWTIACVTLVIICCEHVTTVGTREWKRGQYGAEISSLYPQNQNSTHASAYSEHNVQSARRQADLHAVRKHPNTGLRECTLGTTSGRPTRCSETSQHRATWVHPDVAPNTNALPCPAATLLHCMQPALPFPSQSVTNNRTSHMTVTGHYPQRSFIKLFISPYTCTNSLWKYV